MNKNEISDELAAVQKRLLIVAARNTEEGWRTLVLAAARNCGEARLQLRGEDMAFLPIYKPAKRKEWVPL